MKKNKIVLASTAFLLTCIWLIWITNADFGNFNYQDMLSHRTVIDKLINWETLTADDKTVLEEIKTQRAEAETYRNQMDAQRAELEPIYEKIRAWETLTTDEQNKLDAFRADREDHMWNFWGMWSFGGRGFWGGRWRWGMMWGWYGCDAY